MKIDIGTQVSGVSSKKARTGLKPDTRHLKPILQEAFTTPDKVQKKSIFLAFYEICMYSISHTLLHLNGIN